MTETVPYQKTYFLNFGPLPTLCEEHSRWRKIYIHVASVQEEFTKTLNIKPFPSAVILKEMFLLFGCSSSKSDKYNSRKMICEIWNNRSYYMSGQFNAIFATEQTHRKNWSRIRFLVSLPAVNWGETRTTRSKKLLRYLLITEPSEIRKN